MVFADSLQLRKKNVKNRTCAVIRLIVLKEIVLMERPINGQWKLV